MKFRSWNTIMSLIHTQSYSGLNLEVFPLKYIIVMLGSADSEMVRLISREIIFAEFQPI